jgi:[CysO sulfur-carrier protein]-S-L-cysteine hydrolase
VNRSIRIRRSIFVEALSRARETPRQECCGLLAGRDDIITHIFPAVNAVASATAYEIAPHELFRLMRDIRAAGRQLMGIYHSHPNGKNEPSHRDIERAYYPELAYFILSPQAGAARPVRVFSISEGKVEELEVQIT